VTGRRLPDAEYGHLPKLEPGDYIKVTAVRFADATRDVWFVRAPNGAECYLNKNHTFTEHDDGTLTVAPSIGIYGPVGQQWAYHGFLERGVWRDA
jgi:hypothetical protein